WAIQAEGIFPAPYMEAVRFTGGRGGDNDPARWPRGGGGGAGRDRGRGAAGAPGSGVDTAVLPPPGIQVVCHLDGLPFADGSVTALRANHVLEHQSFQLVGPTLREWARVLAPGARVDIGVPDARYIATQWVGGAYSTLEANYWLLGGHMDRDAHKGA